MIDVRQITQLHREMVVRWHAQEVDLPYEGFLGVVCSQHSFNFLLWHEEDIARSPTVSDERIAQVKRNIDRYNQQRNDGMEQVDDWITALLQERFVSPPQGTPQNTETPGAAVDRLSILSLRIYHLEEQLQREGATPQHVEIVQRKLAVALVQHEDLSTALAQLLDDVFAGRKRHRTYRQLKMYNDPALNPYLYNRARLAS